MSQDESILETLTSKLDIPSVTPSMYRHMIELAANMPRTVICAIGTTGIGKSAIPKEVALSRGAPCVALHVPQIEEVPTSVSDTRSSYERRLQRGFQELQDFVGRLKAGNGGHLPPGRNPILVMEDLHRAAHHLVTQAAFTLLEDRVIGDVRLPDEVQLIVTMDPSGGMMELNQFECEPARRRRLLMVGVTTSHSDFMDYAFENQFHEDVYAFLEAQPAAMFDQAAQLAGRAYPCPASWQTVSKLCYALDARCMKLTTSVARTLIAGQVGMTTANAFLDFVAAKAGRTSRIA